MNNKKGNIPDNLKGAVIVGSGKAALLHKGEVVLPYKDIKNLDNMIRKESFENNIKKIKKEVDNNGTMLS